MKQNLEWLDLLREREQELRRELSPHLVRALFVLSEAELFGDDSGVRWDHLTEALGKSRNTVRTYVAELEKRELIERVSSRPLKVRLTDSGKRLLFPGEEHR